MGLFKRESRNGAGAEHVRERPPTPEPPPAPAPAPEPPAPEPVERQADPVVPPAGEHRSEPQPATEPPPPSRERPPVNIEPVDDDAERITAREAMAPSRTPAQQPASGA